MDTIVIGAGIAGMAAAQRLAKAGKSVTILEARNRKGGRVKTWWIPGVPVPVEMGPEWIGSEGAIHDLLAKDGAPLREAEGHRLRRTDDHWDNLDAMPAVNEGVVERIGALGGGDRTLAAALAECCDTAELAPAKAMFTSYVEGFHAADPEVVSSRWIQQVETTQPAEEASLRTRDGVDQLVRILARDVEPSCEILLRTCVRSIRWRTGEVIVGTGPGGEETYRAPTAIVAVPLSMFEGASREGTTPITFSPALPAKRGAASLLRMGATVKMMFRFREAFWLEERALRKLAFLQAPGQPFPTWWTSIHHEVPLLTAWCAGPHAEALPEDEKQLAELGLASLASGFGMPLQHVTSFYEALYFHDWRTDPWAHGGYTYVASGGIDAHRVLAEPVARTLFFAGEATAGDGYNGTMEGALLSGWRAAEEVLASL